MGRSPIRMSSLEGIEMKRTLLVLLATLCLVGCTNYYKVTDPTTGKTYYTTELRDTGHGSASIKDAKTGNKVSLQNTEVQEISKEEFESGKNAAATPEKMP